MSSDSNPGPALPAQPNTTGRIDPAARGFSALADPEALLFDLDGTLVDTVPVRIEAWRRALEEAGQPSDRRRIGEFIGSDGRFLAQGMGRLAGHELDERAAAAIDARHGEWFDELNSDPVPLAGAAELLAALEESELTFAVATSSHASQAAASVRSLQLPAPPRVVDTGHVAHAKPEPDLLLAAARELGVEPERCWYVGDSSWDMMASVRAGMAGIGVTTGAVDAAALLEAGAAVAVESLRDVLGELRSRGVVKPARPAA